MSITQIFKRYLPRGSFVRGVIVLSGGATASQVILMAAVPILTRLYSAEDFGIVAVFGSILSILSVISSLRYELAIPIANDDEEAVHGIVLALLVALATTLVSFLVIVGFRDQITEAVKIPQMAVYLWLLPLGLLPLSIYKVFSYWAIRVKEFSAIARTKLAQSVSSVAVQVGGASFGAIALLLGQVIGQTVGTSSLALLAIREKYHLFRKVRPKTLLSIAWRYRQFPCFSALGGLLNTVGMQLPPVLFTVLFNPAVAGIYALAHRVLSLPMSLVGQAIGNVFLARAAEARREGNLAVLVAKVHDKLAEIAMPPALILALIAPELFALIFGTEWREAGIFARLMTPMLYFQFILSPISTLFNVLEKQKQGMFLQLAMLVSRCLSLTIGGWLDDARLAVTLFSLASAASYFGFLVWVVLVSGNYWSVIVKPTMKTFGRGLLIVSPLCITTFFAPNMFLLIFSFAITLCLTMWRYLMVLKSES
ncbi:MAG: oligosaccharide flippase family protein [Symploca sp. SIO1C2]|nr:oligosaccharide flippase family protein [Symploca sp. SIO1C2]